MAEEDKNVNSEEAATPESQASAAATPAHAPAGPARPARPAAPVEVLAPKERRRRARAAKVAKTPTRAARTPEERHEERVAERRAQAKARRSRRLSERQKAQATAGPPRPPLAPREHGPGKQKTRQGIVVSDRANKTITVRIDVARRHRFYEKIVRTSSTLHAHDEANDAHIGDTVVVRECRPLSRTKHWRLVQVLERAE